MKLHRERFYAYQTVARGVVDREALVQRFERFAPWYAALLGRFLPQDRGARILDCGCGYGNFSYFLKKSGYRNVRSVDLDPNQVALARAVGLNAEVADVSEVLAEQGATYDCIVAVDFLEHLDKEEAIRFLERASEALRVPGLLILRTPSCDSPFGASHLFNDITHEFGVTSNALEALLRMVGLVSVVFLDERPQLRPPLAVAYLRRAVFVGAAAIATAFCTALNVPPPRIWSPSMWAIARKH
jgi:2-polyprenyl-3-methyl-5-hydroxy-6-metoxy-1,4-benzoquinol methylase